MALLLTLIFLAGLIGIVSLVMSYEELSRIGLVVCALPAFISAVIFIYWWVSAGGLSNISAYFRTPEGSRVVSIRVAIIVGVTFLTLFREGTVFWLWRRIHPSSAPTAELRSSERGNGIRKNKEKMSSALMGTSTSMFKNSELDIRTIALIRLSFAAFSRTDTKTIIGIESFLRLGDGRKYRSYQRLVAEILDSKTTMKDIVHPYWRAINGNVATARIMFADLCRLASVTGNLDKKTINNLIKAGRELGLSQEEMQRAL